MALTEILDLLEREDYPRCAALADEMLLDESLPGEVRARVAHAACRARFALADFFGAIEMGEVAAREALAHRQYDLVGQVFLDMGAALGAVREYDLALSCGDEYFRHKPYYVDSVHLEGKVLYNHATYLGKLERWEDAANTYAACRQWHWERGELAEADEARRRQVEAMLHLGRTEEATSLLIEGEHYVSEASPRTRVEQYLLWATAYLLDGNSDDSAAVAMKALDAAGDHEELQARAHLALLASAEAKGSVKDAVGFALAARVAAIDARRYDLEFEASEALFRLLRQHGAGILQELDGEYRHLGIDLCHYISERSYRRMLSSN
jgi:tetratricopeptide (TPR) repeat protein